MKPLSNETITILLMGCLIVGSGASNASEESSNDWENPEMIGRNKEALTLVSANVSRTF